MISFVVACLWIICGVVEYGLSFAYFQRDYPELAEEDYWDDWVFCIIGAVFGPLSLAATLLCGQYTHGFKFK